MIGNSSSVCNRLTVLPLRSRRWSKEKGSRRGLRTLGINTICIRATVSTTILAVILRFIGVVTIVITTGTVIIAGGSSSDSSDLRLTINTSTAAGNSRCRGAAQKLSANRQDVQEVPQRSLQILLFAQS